MAMTAEQNASIADMWSKIQNDPQAVMKAMTDYGVGAQDLATATGQNVNHVADYLKNAGAGAGFGGVNQDLAPPANSWSNMPADNYQQYTSKMTEARKDPTGAWLAGSSDVSQGAWEAQKARADTDKAKGIAFGGSAPVGQPAGIINNAAGGSVGSTTGASGSSSAGVWNVDDNQLVAKQFNNLTDPNSPLMQKARTQALERMNERGILNSSIAAGAADSAMYDAALGIAKQDAGTYADAAKTNAGAQTSWAIASNNNATSKDIASSNIAAQKELQQSTQLYNNLANQTASASTIQTWGLNTITSIMSSDMSAEAKNAAVAQIKTYLSDSYQIQGDWHTSAAKAIDAIFG